MSDWQYNDEPFNPDEEFIKDYVGFVYLIEEQTSGMKYIGKKLFWKPKVLPITKTRKRRKRLTVESDWRSYWGSSKNLLEDVEQRGEGSFNRTILHLCKSKGDCSYLEAKEQFDREVLFQDDYYNGIINCRVSAKHLKL